MTMEHVPDDPHTLFAVSVRDVVQLVSTLSIALEGHDRDTQGRPVRQGEVYLREQQIEEWIVDVAARLTTRLPLLHRVRPNTRLMRMVATAGHDLVANGAASYVYAAAAPEKAEMIDTTSYAEVLWRRFQTGADELEEAFKRWVKDHGDDLEPDADLLSRRPGSGRFPAPRIRDCARW